MAMMRIWIWTYPDLNKQFLAYLAGKMREQENLGNLFCATCFVDATKPDYPQAY